MWFRGKRREHPRRLIITLLLLVFSLATRGATPEGLLHTLNGYPHASEVESSEAEVIDYEIGLGAMKKVRGVWQFRDSERLSGSLISYTWQIVDGFTSAEVMEELLLGLREQSGSELLFSCDGRACGHSSQWANRVFRQRVLYGREDLQHYRVYAIEQDQASYRLIVYSAARTADRQYLHVELLRLASGTQSAD